MNTIDYRLPGLVLLLLMCYALNAQKIESSIISKLSTEEGLSSNTVYSILQDDKGFIWIATEQGLNKYDGKNLTIFSTESGRYSLTHNRTQTLLAAPDGNIWIGTSDGLNIYDYRSDSIIQVRTDTKPLKLRYNDITTLTQSSNKMKTWIGTYGNGIHYFDGQKQEFFNLNLPEISNAEQPRNIMSLLEDDTRRLWIGSRTNGLYRYDLNGNKLEWYPLPQNGRFVRAIYQDSFRRIWIGTSSGCYVYNETTNRLDQITFPTSLIDNSVGAICEDHNGKLWIGSEMFLMNFSVRAFSLNEKFDFRIFEQGESNFRLSCPSVNALFADRDNNIWIGTAWGGINMLKGTPAKFLLIKHNSDSENSIPNSPINSICTDKSDNLYIANMGNTRIGLCSMNLNTGKVSEIPLNKMFPGYVYQSILIDSHQNLWIGTYNRGLIKSTPGGTNYEQFLSDPFNSSSIPGNDIRTLFESQNQVLWIGTNNGLATYSHQTKKLESVPLPNNQRIAVRAIDEEASGLLWIGTYGNGVVTYDPKSNVINNSPIGSVNPHIISDIHIQNELVYIATSGEGLIKFNLKTKKDQFFTLKNGLPSNYIVSVQCDKAGNVWVGHSKGISKINPETDEVVNFNSGDGLQSREFSDRAAISLPNGQLIFAGFSGLNIFDPTLVTKDDKCPPVVFTRLLVSNEQVAPSKNKRDHSPIKENLALTNLIELKHKQSVFTIEFIGVNYNANSKIQYAYMLEGSDKEWNVIGNQNNVTFRNLRPGNYTFKVKASSPDGVWTNENIATLQVVVKAPFWATVWAYLFYSVLIIILFYFVGLFIILRIEAANNLKIERARREKEEELHQEKLQFFTNISHELRTPLTLIIGPLETMFSEEAHEEKKSNIRLMLHNAKRLLAMVNQLLDFRKSERGQMKLKVQYADILASLREIAVSFEELSKQKEVTLSIDFPDDKLMAWFDIEFMNKSVINLVSNAYKFARKGGVIVIKPDVSQDLLGNEILSISVTDDGMGISSSDIPFIFDRFFQGGDKFIQQQGSGIGLHLVKNLIELHHGTVEVESTPNVKTIFKITIPIERTAYLSNEFLSETEKTKREKAEIDGMLPFYLDYENPDHEKQKRDTRKRILLVEDNADIRHYIRSILEPNYAIEEAENGLAGWDMMNMNEFDLVISDIMMPEMDGIEMCKRMKASVETDHIPIILLTAKSDIENRIEGLSLGADSYITKPFHPKHLSVRVAKLIELRELLKDRYSRKIFLGELHQADLKTESAEEQFLHKAVSIVLEKMVESEFNGDTLASEMNISRMGLYRKIKALTGQTTGEFIRNIRLKKACELLTSDGKNISEVCYSVGFNSPSYFTTCFTELYKMTPTEYVKSMKS